MKIKFTDLYETIQIQDFANNYHQIMRRNVWYDVPLAAANELLKNNTFFNEDFLNLGPFLMEGNKKIAFKRFGALGDLLQFVPIVKYLKYHFDPSNKFTLVTQQGYVDIFKKEKSLFEDVMVSQSFKKSNYDRSISLDGVLENDHNPMLPESKLHRIKIFEDFFCLKLSKEDYDFSLTITKEDEMKAGEILCS